MTQEEQKHLLGLLIHARTALKTNRTDEALKAVREAIRALDPDRTIEITMRENAP